MRYYTTDPAERAADIADREMEAAYRERHDGGNWADFWLRIYGQVLLELVDPQIEIF